MMTPSLRSSCPLMVMVMFTVINLSSGLIASDKIKTEILTVGECHKVASEGDYVTLHFESSYENGAKISSTYDRGVPVEIQLGTKMLSAGLDEGLKGMCIGETRLITMSPDIGSIDLPELKLSPDTTSNLIYKVTLTSISAQTTVNTFNYLDLNGDKRISAEEAESLVRMFMKALNSDLGLEPKDLVSFFISLHDKDGDGYISSVEFMDSVAANEKLIHSFTGNLGNIFNMFKDEL